MDYCGSEALHEITHKLLCFTQSKPDMGWLSLDCWLGIFFLSRNSPLTEFLSFQGNKTDMPHLSQKKQSKLPFRVILPCSLQTKLLRNRRCAAFYLSKMSVISSPNPGFAPGTSAVGKSFNTNKLHAAYLEWLSPCSFQNGLCPVLLVVGTIIFKIRSSLLKKSSQPCVENNCPA